MSEETKWQPAASDSIEFIKPSDLANAGTKGEILTGTFVEGIQNQFNKDKLDYKFKRESDGATVVINSTGSLSYQMRNVIPGTLCQVLYNGKETITKGPMKGKEAHNFKVNVAVE
jgi:hypothetical protein